jgi:tetratricopeptide (TPR) repeat protein
VPIAQATTGSFEALRAYSVGEQAHDRGDNAAALSLYSRAVELDPSFAMAHLGAAIAYANLRESEPSRQALQRAFNLRDRTSEIERLQIAATYYQFVGNYSQAARTYGDWTHMYPLDPRPWVFLANLYTRMARYEEAADAAKRALQMSPDSNRPYVVLARAYKRLGRFDEAKAVGRQAAAKGLDDWNLHCLLYEVAFATGDSGLMSEEVAKERDQSTEGWMLEYEALAAATSGKLHQFRTLMEQAIAMTRARSTTDQDAVVSEFSSDYIDTLAEAGLQREAAQLIVKTPQLDTVTEAPFGIALAGEFARASAIAEENARRYPANTEINMIHLPLARAAILLGQHEPRAAIAALQPALPWKLTFLSIPWLLGNAYMQNKEFGPAAEEYRLVLRNRGVDATSILYPLAMLGLARALNMDGQPAESGAAYQRLFAFWKDADADNPVLEHARTEYALLTH